MLGDGLIYETCTSSVSSSCRVLRGSLLAGHGKGTSGLAKPARDDRFSYQIAALVSSHRSESAPLLLCSLPLPPTMSAPAPANSDTETKPTEKAPVDADQEPQNALTEKFTEKEWAALKELRVSTIKTRFTHHLRHTPN